MIIEYFQFLGLNRTVSTESIKLIRVFEAITAGTIFK